MLQDLVSNIYCIIPSVNIFENERMNRSFKYSSILFSIIILIFHFIVDQVQESL